MYGVSECQTPCLTDVQLNNARPGWFSPKFKTADHTENSSVQSKFYEFCIVF